MRIKCFLISVSLTLFAISFSFSQTYNWGHVAIGGGGFVDGIIISKTNPKVMYSRTDVGGAYRWDSVNTKWVQMLDWVSQPLVGYLGIESMALDPQDNNKIYLLAGTSYFSNGSTAILRSTDGGKTFPTSGIIDVSNQFKAHGNGMGRQNGEKLVVDPNVSSTLFCGTRWNGLFKSTNSGTTWTNVTTTGNATANGNGISFVVLDPSTGTKGTTASQTIVFGVSQTSNNLYISTNGGGAFTAITGGPSLMPQRAVLASDRTLYIAYADLEGPWNPTKGAIWKYNLGTSKWTDITPFNNAYSYGGISVDPNNANRIIVSTINKYLLQYNYNGSDLWGDRFYLSTNGGTSWSDLVTSAITLNSNNCTWMPGNTIHWAGDIQFNPSNTAQAFVISGNGLFQCDNVNSTASTWKFAGIGIEETVPLDIVSIPSGPLFSVIGDYDGFKHTDIFTYAPVHSPGMGSTTGIAYAAANTSYLVRVGAKMYFTTNQGTAWTQCGTMNGTKGKVAVAANNGVIVHCPETSSTFYRSTNNGTSWTNCNGVSITDGVPVADPVNNTKFYAYNNSDGKIYVSTDGGANFSASGSPGTGGSKIIRTVPGREGHLWVALYTGGLTRSTNSGASFTKLSAVTSCDAVGLGKAAPSAAYETVYIWGVVGGVTGIFRSIDQGVTWTRINDDAHQYGGPGNGNFVIGDWNTYGRVYMSTVGLGIVYGDLTTTTAPTVTVAISSSASSICSGKAVTLTSTVTVSNGTISKVDFYDGTTLLGTSTASPYTFSWTNATVGTHTVSAKATDNTSAVTTSSSISITVNALPTVSAGTDVGICTGKSTILTASGATTYSWSNAISTATNSVSPTITTTYSVTGTTAGCLGTDAVIVTVNALPTLSAGTDVGICTGKSTTLTASGATTYSWSNAISTATNSVSPTITTTYSVTGTTAGCLGTDAVIVTVNALPTVSAGTDVGICTGKSTTLTASGATTYSWSNAISTATNSVSPTITTTYSVTGTTAGCLGTDAVIVTVNALPTVSAGIDVGICTGKSTTLTASGATTYSWSNAISTATNTVSPTITTTYSVTGTTAGCLGTDAVIVTVNALPTVSAGTDVGICTGKSTTLTATGGSSYSWSNGILAATNTVSSTITTTYTVTGTNASGCTSIDAVIVTVNAFPTIIPYMQIDGGSLVSVGDTTIVAGQSITLVPQPNGTSGWIWSGPNSYSASTRQINLTSITLSQSGKYSVTYTDVNGCVATFNHQISVLAKQTITLNQGWNLISTNVSPKDSSIEMLFNGLNVQEIKTMDAFWEKGQNIAFNGLKSITTGNGYLVYMNTAGVITITGGQTSSGLVALKTGWNLIGCPFQTSSALSTYFNASNTSLIKDFTGFWLPTGTTNSISTLDPGKGCFLKK
jgi:xyloglucan-specific exo-beta-1,4-glucanase